MLGDLNIVEDSADRKPPHPDNATAVENLRRLKNYFHLHDGWRKTFPDTLKYSYLQGTTHSRIDRIYATEKIYKFTCDWEIQNTPIKNADHDLVSMKFINPTVPYQGKGRWSIPPFMLQSPAFIEQIANIGLKLQETLTNLPGHDIQTEHKKFKDEIIRYARLQATKKACAIGTIIKQKMERLESVTMDSGLEEDEKRLLMAILREDIRDLERKLHEKKRTKVHARNIIEGETISKYWFELNKERAPWEPIVALKNPMLPPRLPRKDPNKRNKYARVSN